MMDDDGKIALVAFSCMLALAFASALRGYQINPVALGAPAYMYMVRMILGVKCPIINCSLVIVGVSALVYVFYLM
ncbi:MAG: hypothetical protein B6U97_04410 [Candidatus Altiarchaeales archaeon ex4484_96]|nr:MAG: hypothetical protein B6U97_04410 [Candidatus Altiarchaeales archaeon ex4484_96]